VTLLAINAIVYNITQAADSINGSSSADICPELIPPDFNPDNSNYKHGTTNVDFRIDRSLSTNDWKFNYTISGGTVLQTILTGNSSTPTRIGPTINAGTNNKVYMRFKIDNDPSVTHTITLTIIIVTDNVTSCFKTYVNNKATQVIKPMPAVGPFN
jgi:hypothetical protein